MDEPGELVDKNLSPKWVSTFDDRGDNETGDFLGPSFVVEDGSLIIVTGLE